MSKAKNFFTAGDQQQIMHAIQDAEKNTSGEIRVHLDDTCSGDPLMRAGRVFTTMGMHRTENRNGVLIYLSIEDHKFAIVGDTGIDAKVPAGFWDSVRDIMLEDFSGGNYTLGLTKGIREAGDKLKQYFPYLQGDKNEMPDTISF